MPIDVDQAALEALVAAPGYQTDQVALEALVQPPAYQVDQVALEALVAAEGFRVAELQLEILVRLPTTIPPLRQRQRDDTIRQRSVNNPPRSRRGSLRQGWQNTYA